MYINELMWKTINFRLHGDKEKAFRITGPLFREHTGQMICKSTGVIPLQNLYLLTLMHVKTLTMIKCTVEVVMHSYRIWNTPTACTVRAHPAKLKEINFIGDYDMLEMT